MPSMRLNAMVILKKKIRAIYQGNEVEITLDVYPYRVWVEVGGDQEKFGRLQTSSRQTRNLEEARSRA